MSTRYPAFASAVVLGVALFGFSGCIATSTEMAGLHDDIYELQLRLDEVQRNQADLSAKMDTLNASLGPLDAQLQETQNRMSLLGQRLDDIDASISQRVNKLSEQLSGSSLSVSPPPSEVYRLAYSDFSSGKYDLAIVGFKSYLEKYPQGEMAPQAQYYLGECYYSQNNWVKALEQFENVERSYSRSDSVPPARLKRALSLELLGQTREAREVLESLAKEYPHSPEAFTATEKLDAAKTNGK